MMPYREIVARMAAVAAIATCIVVAASGADPQTVGSPAKPVTTAPGGLSQRAFLDKYCVTCHNQRLKTAGLVLDQLDLANVGQRADVWEKVVRKLRGGVMPPAGLPRPDDATYEAFLVSLEHSLDRAAAARPNPGRT